MLIVSPHAAVRLRAARDFLASHPKDAPRLVIAPTWDAADEIARTQTPAFGLQRITLDRLALQLAGPALAVQGKAPATRLAFTALVCRAVHQERAHLKYFTPVADRPGFAPALTQTLTELRMQDVVPAQDSDLHRLASRVRQELDDARLVDRAAIYALALENVGEWAAVPLLLLDLALDGDFDTRLVEALARRAPSVLGTVPRGDERTLERMRAALNEAPEFPQEIPQKSLQALQVHLFEPTATPHDEDESVLVTAWPGEARECIEIARRIQEEARRGVAFDKIAVFLHEPQTYRPHLEEALERADIPAYFTEGARRPHPSGRAFLALLQCAAERLSARRFAEYLSLAQVPEPDGPPPPWAPPTDDLLPFAAVDDADPVENDPTDDDAVRDGSLRAPWRWEQVLVDAAVIGGGKRWRRRLEGHANKLLRDIRDAEPEDSGRAEKLARDLENLEHLRNFALPVLDRLEALPDSACWEEWLPLLKSLAGAALREPDPVIRKLGQLDPMGPVGPVTLDEVRLALGQHLAEVTSRQKNRRYGAVYVASTANARGLQFDVVFTPGLAERVFPARIVEDPILLDEAREEVSARLATQKDRVASERLSLRLAVGAATHRVHLSYPRLDVQQARPRVPSFYALEALRAAEGILPGLDVLTRRTMKTSPARLGWPAPEDPRDAVDEAEYDLALLAPRLQMDPERTVGTAHYLLTANPHLARTLRARARRWIARWTPADGVVEPDAAAVAALQADQMDRRSFSPTALQNFAGCPYRFFLSAIARLAPREEPVAVEHLDPRDRGSIFHQVQFQILSRLRDDGLLPLKQETLPRALEMLDGYVDATAATWAEKLAPAIPRVWDDTIQRVRADLREWLRRTARDVHWRPEKFELAFGLKGRERGEEDPSSVPDPVPVAGRLQLRGCIDLIEVGPDGGRRATDHKTGRAPKESDLVIKGGEVLQPLMYALVCEKLLGPPVSEGRLYYATADEGYSERSVPLNDETREIARGVVETIDEALRDGFLPAYPREDGCKWCDFRPVCGPHEETRTARKPKTHTHIQRLREMRGKP
ncbi:MAG: Dna2/Cas4 domain-containing protein [Armatimonadetes bacterium]|nr:Dna2/Cas4 domain-containing protein [Armatimonadota bacterium]